MQKPALTYEQRNHIEQVMAAVRTYVEAARQLARKEGVEAALDSEVCTAVERRLVRQQVVENALASEAAYHEVRNAVEAVVRAVPYLETNGQSHDEVAQEPADGITPEAMKMLAETPPWLKKIKAAAEAYARGVHLDFETMAEAQRARAEAIERRFIVGTCREQDMRDGTRRFGFAMGW